MIADSSSPAVFSSYSPNQRYSSISAANNGTIPTDGAPTIRIQAVLGPAYFNQLTNYVKFTVGNGGATLYDGLAVNNIPLEPSTGYEISFYILFYNATGVSTFHYVCLRTLYLI